MCGGNRNAAPDEGRATAVRPARRSARAFRAPRSEILDAIVVGAGPAGLAAGVQLVRSGLGVIAIERGRPGGQLHSASLVENYPGISPMPGRRLALRLAGWARAAGLRILRDEVLRVSGRGPFTVETRRGMRRARVVVVAAGAGPRGPGELPSVYGLENLRRYRGRRVVIIGGGDAAFDCALRLCRVASRVSVVCRGRPSALPLLVERCRRAGVLLIQSAPLKGVSRTARGFRVETAAGELSADDVLTATGKEPREEILPLPLSELRPHPLTGRTGVPGLYVVGDLSAGRYRQVAVAAGMGVAAAMDAAEFLGAGGEGWGKEEARRGPGGGRI
ncbi:MAG: NAD(P)/FAD-dependent oxidoreductase [Thermoplasmata archaeon]